MIIRRKRSTLAAALLSSFVIGVVSCGKDGAKQEAAGKTPRGTNLIRNASFEDVEGGVPAGWQISPFRGAEGMKASVHGIDDSLAVDGARSFFFKADRDTRRFFTLTQEIPVEGVDRVRLRGKIRTAGVERHEGHYPQSNFALTYYDADHNRFNASRFADGVTRPVTGTSDGWVEADRLFRLPRGTAYIVVHCAFGMQGTIWFDAVSVEAPEDLDWQRTETDFITHYWLPEKQYPEGSIDFQDRLYDYYADRLGIPEAEREHVDYFLYPDSATMRKRIGRAADLWVDYERKEVHSLHPVDPHEIIHIMTDAYGQLPRLLGEGTAYYLMDDYKGEYIQPLAQKLLREGKLPTVREMADAMIANNLEADRAVPAAASFIGYLVEFGGPDRFLDLHRQVINRDTYEGFAKAFDAAYGKSLDEAEASWRRLLESADFSKWTGQRPQQESAAKPQSP